MTSARRAYSSTRSVMDEGDAETLNGCRVKKETGRRCLFEGQLDDEIREQCGGRYSWPGRWN